LRNIFRKRRFLFVIISLIYIFYLLSQKGQEGWVFFDTYFYIITALYIFSFFFLRKILDSHNKIKKISKEIIDDKFDYSEMNMIELRETYDRATYEIINSLSSKLKNQNLKNSELSSVVSNITFGLILIDTEDTIIFANKEFKKIIKAPQEIEYENKKIVDIVQNKNFFEVINELKNNRDYIKKEIKFLSEIDSSFIIRAGYINNEKSKILITLADITEFKKLDKIKEDLVASVSHEIRTPLSGIIGATQFIQEHGSDNNEEILSMIDIIERNSRRLSNITNDLLALAELEEKEKLDLEREYAYSNIIEIAKYSIEILKIHSEKKKIRIKTNFSSDEISIKCLSSEIEKIFINLLQNAINYSPENDEIIIKITKESSNLIIEIIDNGPGVNTIDKEYIFNRFYTADKNRSYSSLGGTGLGLSIVKHAANLHSGKVELIDTTKGATFRVTIPQIN